MRRMRSTLPLGVKILTLAPSGIRRPSVFSAWYSTLDSLVKPNFSLTNTFYLPGSLKRARLRAVLALSRCWGLQRMDMRMWPMSTRAHLPWAFP